MDTVTYPDAQVVRELSERFVAVKVESGKQPELARRMGVRWLPGLVVADADERPAHVQVGFLPPADLVLELAFGRAILAMGAKQYDQAHELFRQVAETDGAERAPEAYFWWGISRYRQLKDFRAAVTEPWSAIVAKWPGSQWARKVGYALGQPASVA